MFKRLLSPTPRFFRRVRRAGLLLTGLAAILAAPPFSLAVAVTATLAAAGSAAALVAQLVKTDYDTGGEL